MSWSMPASMRLVLLAVVTLVRNRRIASVFLSALTCCALASLTAGCASTGTDHSDLSAATSKPADRAPVGQARLTLNRVSGVLYAGAPATVKVNGEKVADLWAGSSSTVNVAPGANAVTVEAWSYPGTWTVNLDAKPGQTYAVEISPRGESYVPGMFGVVGAAIDAANNKKRWSVSVARGVAIVAG